MTEFESHEVALRRALNVFGRVLRTSAELGTVENVLKTPYPLHLSRSQTLIDGYSWKPCAGFLLPVWFFLMLSFA